MGDINTKDAVSQYKDYIIERGLEECKTLISEQESETMKEFYRGSIDGFEESKSLETPDDFRKRIDELKREELEYISIYLENEDPDILKKIWYLRGLWTQLNFVYERISIFV